VVTSTPVPLLYKARWVSKPAWGAAENKISFLLETKSLFLDQSSQQSGHYADTDISILLSLDSGNTRVAPKLMHPILLCWHTTSEADVGNMAVEVKTSRQYSVKFCCRATDDSRGAV
jgi:hypothetical protein